MVSTSPNGTVDICAGKGKLPARDFSANVFVVLTSGSGEEYIQCDEAFRGVKTGYVSGQAQAIRQENYRRR
jgi:hypothetical protein